MKRTASKDWLDRFLSGDIPDEADLKKLAQDCPKEDQHLDYKSGKILTTGTAADVVREYVAAFANSDGGTLLVGYDQATGFDGAIPPGASTLEEWATRCISSLAPFLSPPPRIFTARVTGATVLLIATARAPRLVPVPFKGDLVHYIRINESNFVAPPFLHSDLVLGRRNHPVLRLLSVSGTGSLVVDIDCPNVDGADLGLRVAIENSSMVFAQDVRCGIITWCCSAAKPHLRDGRSVPDSLKACVDVLDPPHYKPLGMQPHWQLAHVRLARHTAPGFAAQPDEPPIDLGALDQTGDEALKPFTIPLFKDLLRQAGQPQYKPGSPFYDSERQDRIQLRGASELKAAVYVLSRNAEPWWSQLTMRYDKRTLDANDLAGC